MRSYYDVLGVARDACDDQLKKAYRKLSIKIHPDKNQAPEANETFKKVNAAYYCLTDGNKRAVYDRTGEDPGDGP